MRNCSTFSKNNTSTKPQIYSLIEIIVYKPH